MLTIIAISRNEAQEAFYLLAKTAAKRENEFGTFQNLPHLAKSEDDEDSDYPILRAFQIVEGSSVILSMTLPLENSISFLISLKTRLKPIVILYVDANHLIRRKMYFFMMLCVLKHGWS